MMPPYLANAAYDSMSLNVAPWTSAAAQPGQAVVWPARGNVIEVDFARKMPAQQARSLAGNNMGDLGEWRSVAAERLASLRHFRPGWDGPGSKDIAEPLLALATSILDLAFKGRRFPAPPSAAPAGDGSIQLEWWLVDTRFEMTIEADGDLEAWALDRSSGHEFEASGTEAIELLTKWSARLTADKLALPA